MKQVVFRAVTSFSMAESCHRLSKRWCP